MIKFIKNLEKNLFLKSLITLFNASTLASLIYLISLPILTRIYSPSEYGVYGSLVSISSIFLTICCLRYETAIPISINKFETYKLIILSSFILLFFLIILIFIYFTLYPFFNLFDNFSIINDNIYLFLLFILLGGINLIIRFTLIKFKNFKILGNMKVIEFSSRFFLQILFLSWNYVGLFIGHVLSFFLPIIYFFSKFKFLKKKKLSLKQIKKVSYKYDKYPKFSTLEALVNIFGYSIPTIFFFNLFGHEIAGYYFLAVSLMSLPLVLLGRTVNTVYYSLSPKKNKKKFKSLFYSINKNLIEIFFPFYFLIQFSLQDMIPIIFGSNWLVTGKICSYMCAWFFLSILSDSLNNTVNITRNIKEDFYLKLFFLILRLFTLFTLYNIEDSNLGILIYVMVNTVIALLNIIWFHYLAGINLVNFFILVTRKLVISLIYSVPLIIAIVLDFENNLKILFFILSLITIFYILNSKVRKYFKL